MRKKPILKGTSFSLRVPPKVRYGIDLLCHMSGKQLSTIVVDAIEAEFDRQGLTAKKKGEMLTLLDKLWDESPGMRLMKLKENAPELMSRDDSRKLDLAIKAGEERGSPLTPEELDEFLQGLDPEYDWTKIALGDVPESLAKWVAYIRKTSDS